VRVAGLPRHRYWSRNAMNALKNSLRKRSDRRAVYARAKLESVPGEGQDFVKLESCHADVASCAQFQRLCSVTAGH
jgi:hypothetical protein